MNIVELTSRIQRTVVVNDIACDVCICTCAILDEHFDNYKMYIQDVGMCPMFNQLFIIELLNYV